MGFFTQRGDIEAAKRELEAAKQKLRQISTAYRLKPVIMAAVILAIFASFVYFSR